MTDHSFSGSVEALLPCEQSPRSLAHTRHGHTIGGTYSPTYYSWQAMLARCRYVERDTDNKHAGRGISVCESWKSFDAFLGDMGNRPLGKTLERIDNDEGYYPANCKWATPIEQARNRRNARLTFEKAFEIAVRGIRGERPIDLAREFQISESLPREIIKGRTWKDALAAAKEITNG